MWKRTGSFAVAAIVMASAAQAQSRVGSDSATRLTRFGRDMVYGTAEGLAFAGIDQLSDSPAQWGKGWSGYGKRAASNVGEFVIQEGVTEGLAAAMNRPLDYAHCECHGTGARIGWAISQGFSDVLPNKKRMVAVPRIVGAFAGSFAQASWRPDTGPDKVRVALVNGATSMVIGVGINLWHEFVR
ncbi:MAG TPA: hypothetical protein VN706_16625 [Gemmatimonadaceae bacterium]|nr:hypothetical protein [Gemmatimonadaceae bacterium]